MNKEGSELKINKVEPKEVSIIDLIIEIRKKIRKLRGELKQLKDECYKHKESAPYRRLD